MEGTRTRFSWICRGLIGLLAVVLPGLGNAYAATTAGPELIPQPREVHPGVFEPVRSAEILVPGRHAEDLFAAENLRHALEQRGVRVGQSANVAAVRIRLLRADTSEARRLLHEEELTFDPAMHDEGYVLIARRRSVAIIAETSAGIFYGVQTLKQLFDFRDGKPGLWTGTIRDWPAMKYRGIDDDLSRGPFPTLEFQKHQLDVFAAYKVNIYSPYFENTLQYPGDPLAAPPGRALSRAEARELVAYAQRLHITIVPEQEAFGHLHHLLQYEKYADLAEIPHGSVLAPGQSGSLPLIASWFAQIAQDFPGPFLHIGADETFELGTGRTSADVAKRGLGPVYADFLSAIHATLAPLHRRLLFWGDVAWNDAAAVSRLPKDMIAIPWVYWHEDNYDPNIVPFRNAGIETWVAPGDANWSVVYPLGAAALDNISGFVEAGQRLGSTGELTTVWNDDGEGLFNQDWFGVLFGAAAGWQPGRSAAAPYQAAFGKTFYGDDSGRIDEAEREMIAAEDLVSVSDDAFWIDPWSPQGQAMAGHLRSKIPQSRLHAEHAIELIEEARSANPALRESDALDAMELGARRIDFIGMKFQWSDEMSEAWAKAYALRNDPAHQTEARELLYLLSSTNGRCQDLRDGYSMLEDLYRKAWLQENRPEWLGNVLVRYDLRVQLWQKRGENITSLIHAWQRSHTLPTAVEAGIPPAPSPL